MNCLLTIYLFISSNSREFPGHFLHNIITYTLYQTQRLQNQRRDDDLVSKINHIRLKFNFKLFDFAIITRVRIT